MSTSREVSASLTKAFSHWDRAALIETVTEAEKAIARHDGDIQKARDAISDLAYGNVSVSCRNHYRPLDDVLRVMQAHGYFCPFCSAGTGAVTDGSTPHVCT